MNNYKELSKKMVDEQLIPRGIKSRTVLEAMCEIPRHLFVPEQLQNYAYDDCPLPIGNGQTISQPYIVAYMTELLSPQPGMKVLEIGTGSGYQTAVLAYLGCKVYTIELVEELYLRTKELFIKYKYDNIYPRLGDGHEGWSEEAPFDAVIVTAAPEIVPANLLNQLSESGLMVIPAGGEYQTQILKQIFKKRGSIYERNLLPVRFVPMRNPDLTF